VDLSPGSDRPADDDFALMDAVASRDQGALSLLYDRHASEVLGVCIRILKERGEAEEVTGDVFTEVWDRATRYDATRGHPVAYLLNLARSRAIDRLRTKARRDRIIVDAEGGVGPGGGSRRPAEAVAAGSPFADALTGQMRNHIERAMGGLHPEQKRALILAYFDGMSHSEIASALGEPLGTVKTRIRQGLLRLRESLDALYGEGAQS
jgi:RNA polymerase sigma-70 factor (ECF subfamily)